MREGYQIIATPLSMLGEPQSQLLSTHQHWLGGDTNNSAVSRQMARRQYAGVSHPYHENGWSQV
jgi:hypothetical protein